MLASRHFFFSFPSLAVEDKRVVVADTDLLATEEVPTVDHLTRHHSTHPCELLSADDLDHGGRFSGCDFSLGTSSDSQEAYVQREQETALCEEVEFYLEQQQLNKENRVQPRVKSPVHIPRANQPPAPSTYKEDFHPPRPAQFRKPLRRPKQDLCFRTVFDSVYIA